MTEQDILDILNSYIGSSEGVTVSTLEIIAKEISISKQDSAAEIARLKDTLDAIRRHRITYEVIIGEHESTIAQLQANNNDLREALLQASRQLDLYEPSSTVCKIVSEALSLTPEQSLQDNDNEVIEQIAEYVCKHIGSYVIAKDIRELKGKL